jgi:hypothetical protein
MRLLQCIRGLRALPMMIASAGRSAGWIPGPGDNCGGPLELTRADPVCDQHTPHKVYADVSRRTGIPILHIADATGLAIHQAEVDSSPATVGQ